MHCFNSSQLSKDIWRFNDIYLTSFTSIHNKTPTSDSVKAILSRYSFFIFKFLSYLFQYAFNFKIMWVLFFSLWHCAIFCLPETPIKDRICTINFLSKVLVSNWSNVNLINILLRNAYLTCSNFSNVFICSCISIYWFIKKAFNIC